MRIAVCGLGFMGSTHVKAMQSLPSAELAAVVSADPVKLSGDLSNSGGNLDLKGELYDFSMLRRYTRLEEALSDPVIEAVDLCLPTYLHCDAAVAALEAGKHVLVEKPMALDAAQCDRMVEASKRADRVLMIGHVLRFWPDYQPLIDACRSRALGSLTGIQFRRQCAAPSWSRWLLDPAQSGGGVFDLMIHDVDMCIYLFGLPDQICSTGVESLASGRDEIHAELHYPKLLVRIDGGWIPDTGFMMGYDAAFENGELTWSSDDPPIEPPPPMDGFQREIDYFVQCASDNQTPALCPGWESAAAVKLCRLIADARKQPGERIPCQI